MGVHKKKIGRNEKCPCGSGLKYKKCHLKGEELAVNCPESDMQKQLSMLEAREYQRKEQQGFGREIISTEFQGHRFVAVGSELHYAPQWKTFYDFLDDYIKRILGTDWFTEELKKNPNERHPILNWYEIWINYKTEHIRGGRGEVISSPQIGATSAYFGLAYNLYLLHHNEGIQTELIRRLKLSYRPNFHGALYETCVAAYFVKAGYELEFENELDSSQTHCEFTATSKKTGRKFSVEAKTLQLKKTGTPNIISKLNQALKKQAAHERLVFIDIGRISNSFSDSQNWLLGAERRLRELEEKPKLDGASLPPAYILFTNYACWYNLEGNKFQFGALYGGFKIPFFNPTYKATVADAMKEREEHREVLDLFDSIKKHQDIPSTFDGENPEIAFSPEDFSNRLIIGNNYNIPHDGKDIVATLRQAVVIDSKKEVFGIYETSTGSMISATCPLSEAEFAAYKKHPQTFFGVIQPSGKAENPFELYDAFYSVYKDAPKENLLNLMKNWQNYEELKQLTQEELAKRYSEACLEFAMVPQAASNSNQIDC